MSTSNSTSGQPSIMELARQQLAGTKQQADAKITEQRSADARKAAEEKRLVRKNGRLAVAAGLKPEEGDKAVALRDQLRVLNAQQIVTWGELNRTKNSPAAHEIHEVENERIANEIADLTEGLSGGDVMYHIASLSVALENINGGVRVPNDVIFDSVNRLRSLGLIEEITDEDARARKTRMREAGSKKETLPPQDARRVLRVGKKQVIAAWFDSKEAQKIAQAEIVFALLQDVVEAQDRAALESRRNRKDEDAALESMVNGTVEEVLGGTATFALLSGITDEDPWTYGPERKFYAAGPVYLKRDGDVFGLVAPVHNTRMVRTIEVMELGRFMCGPRFSKLVRANGSQFENPGKAFAFLAKASGMAADEGRGSRRDTMTHTIGDAALAQGVDLSRAILTDEDEDRSRSRGRGGRGDRKVKKGGRRNRRDEQQYDE
jgi:hypothetical protein